ncbi:MAG: DUF1080 domain-containing protein, partial [Planctomycetia bacterium]
MEIVSWQVCPVSSARRIVSAALLLALGVVGHAAADDVGFTPIFDGKTLDGWAGDPEIWTVKDGAIVGETVPDKPIKTNTFLIWTQGNVDDFELEFRYRLTGGNSGVQYRSKQFKDVGPFSVGGYQGDFEAGPKYSGILYEERGRGILTLRGQRITINADGTKTPGEAIGTAEDLQKVVRPGDWNDMRIVAHG